MVSDDTRVRVASRAETMCGQVARRESRPLIAVSCYPRTAADPLRSAHWLSIRLDSSSSQAISLFLSRSGMADQTTLSTDRGRAFAFCPLGLDSARFVVEPADVLVALTQGDGGPDHAQARSAPARYVNTTRIGVFGRTVARTQ